MNGYVSLDRLPVFDTEALSWATLQCGGCVPPARSGHVGVGAQLQDGGAHIYIFGGGNSATGFADLHELDCSSWHWKLLHSGEDTGTDRLGPVATEGTAVALSGGIMLVCGGYTSKGATRHCFAWGCDLIGDESPLTYAPQPLSLLAHQDRNRIRILVRLRPSRLTPCAPLAQPPHPAQRLRASRPARMPLLGMHRSPHAGGARRIQRLSSGHASYRISISHFPLPCCLTL